MTINLRYKSETGTIYELRGDDWYRDGKKFSKAVFLSSRSAMMQHELLKNKHITIEEFFSENDSYERGYVYSLQKKNGKNRIKHSSKLTKIVEETIGLRKENS